MDSVTIYILNPDGSIRNQRVGNVGSLMLAVDMENLDYTLTKPPDYNKVWYWYNNQWNDKPND